MSLVKVTTKERNGIPYVKDVLIDLGRIVEPIIENVSNDVIISLNETSNLQGITNHTENNVQYVIDETLASFIALSPVSMFIGTVISIDGRDPVNSSAGFIVEKIIGALSSHPSGSSFFYQEDGLLIPLQYIVSQTPLQIISLLAPPIIPTSPFSVYSALLSQSGVTAPVAIILENQLSGPIVFTYDGIGLYTGTLTGAFPANKTFILDGVATDGDLDTTYTFNCVRIDDDTIGIGVLDTTGNGLTNDALSNTALEIKILN